MATPDLNLLVTLDVLLAEGSVARAARRLRLSPSAMSRALARLRVDVRPPLPVRDPASSPFANFAWPKVPAGKLPFVITEDACHAQLRQAGLPVAEGELATTEDQALKAAQAMGDAYLLPSIAAVVLGGTSILGGSGSYMGTVAGVILITLLQSILSVMQIDEAGRQVIYGAVIIVMMLLYGRSRPFR